MKIKLNTEEMLSQWRLRRALEPLRNDCTIERIDGVDTETLLRNELNDWYKKLLDTAPPEFLCLTDISDKVAMVKHVDGSATIKLPDRCRRVIEINLDCWHHPAIIVAPDSHMAQLQCNPYSQSRYTEPVAVKYHSRLMLYSIPPNHNAEIVSLLCVMEPADGFYEMDERALSLINDYEQRF